MTSIADRLRRADLSIRIGSLAFAVSAVMMAVANHLGWEVTYYAFETMAASVVIWFACDPFAEAAQWVGRQAHVPGSVRGATLDAVASSMPELFIGIFFVSEFQDFGASVATCAGSAMFNMAVIPAACAIAISRGASKRPYLEVDRAVVARDGIWFIAAELFLVYCLYAEHIAVWSAIVLLIIYAAYVTHLSTHAVTHRRNVKREAAERNEEPSKGEGPEHVHILGRIFQPKLNWTTCILVLLVSTGIVAFASHGLVSACENVSKALDVPAFLVAVIVVAAASSVPDTLLSIGAAMRGDHSGAVSNAFGSNTFDVSVCLSVPVLIHAVQKGGVMSLAHDEGVAPLSVVLIILSVVTLLLLRWGYKIGRGKAIVLSAIYLVFAAYAVVANLW